MTSIDSQNLGISHNWLPSVKLFFLRLGQLSSAMRAGDIISEANVRSMRPAGGLLPVHLKDLVGKRVSEDLEIGAAVTWDVVEP